jgi:hypothetical protein
MGAVGFEPATSRTHEALRGENKNRKRSVACCEVGVQAAALEAAGGVGGEQSGDPLLAAWDWLPTLSFR